MYELLVERYPTLGAAIGYAAAIGRHGSVDRGLAVLDELDTDRVQRRQPFWAVQAWLLAEQGRDGEAGRAYEQAIGLSTDPGVRAWLMDQRRRRVG